MPFCSARNHYHVTFDSFAPTPISVDSLEYLLRGSD